MAKLILKSVLPAVIGLAMVAGGCFSGRTGVGAPVRGVAMTVESSEVFEKAVLTAAARRRWTPQKLGDGKFRLLILQRDNCCVVDVVQDSENSFSILPIESNIQVRKYDQWVNNLQREIVRLTMMK